MAMLGCWTRSWRSDGSKTTSSCLEEIQTELHYFQVEPSFTPSYILVKQDAMSIDAVTVETDMTLSAIAMAYVTGHFTSM